MLLTLTTTRPPATDLGFLLHKHPAKVSSFSQTFGTAHVFWPEAREDRATAALLVEVDPVDLSRRRHPDEARPLEPYVNDRPYVASSFLSVAIGDVFRTALSGRCENRPDLVGLTARIPALPGRGGERVLRALFEPLGYAVDARRLPLSAAHPAWGDSSLFDVSLTAERTVADLLSHLYVLLPVLDDDKHYWVGEDEIDKLLRHGDGWLSAHPERQLITERYLKHQRKLSRAALARMAPDEDAPEDEPEAVDLPPGAPAAKSEAELESKISLNETRMKAVHAAIHASGALRVLDLGCGEGKLLRRLAQDRQFEEIVGVDVSVRALEIATERLKLDDAPGSAPQRVRLLHGSLTYRDARIAGFDAAACVEVVEHLEPERLPSFARALFGAAKPKTVVLTTPNAEYNAKFPDLPAGKFRHADHRFEWTRAEFEAWCTAVGQEFGYTFALSDIGEADPDLGAPTRMAVFSA